MSVVPVLGIWKPRSAWELLDNLAERGAGTGANAVHELMDYELTTGEPAWD